MNFYFKILNIFDFDLFDFDHLIETYDWITLDKINRYFKKFIKTLNKINRQKINIRINFKLNFEF